MATFNKAISKDLLDSLLPVYGSPRTSKPIWDEGQKMFILKQYSTNPDHRYYMGVRFSNRMAFVEVVGIYCGMWTYLDSLTMFVFNGLQLELAQKKSYEKTFRSNELVRNESVVMARNYYESLMKSNNVAIEPAQLDEWAGDYVDQCFKSFLDQDYNIQLTQILPQLKEY